MSFGQEAQAAEAVASDVEKAAPEVAHAVGEVIDVIETDGSKTRGIIVGFVKNAFGELVAMIHHTHGLRPVNVTQTASGNDDPKAGPVEPLVPVIAKVAETSAAPATEGG